ncbi:Uncharacterized protein Fot_30290 [Forsythia ovata]|uniref:Uncharacterized protein n=1 Tax=Forsythia ovata TaxID=205694 RepID=A0ABD1TUC9_9LAMI
MDVNKYADLPTTTSGAGLRSYGRKGGQYHGRDGSQLGNYGITTGLDVDLFLENVKKATRHPGRVRSPPQSAFGRFKGFLLIMWSIRGLASLLYASGDLPPTKFYKELKNLGPPLP